MRRSLARPWREQRRGKSGDLAWEESLWEKRWNYAERNSVYGRPLERRRSVRNQEEQTAPTVPGEGFASAVCLGGELSWPRSLQQARPNAVPKTIRRWASAGISSAQAPSQQLPYFRVFP